MLTQNSEITFYSSIKRWELFEKIFELSLAEISVVKNYLKIKGELRYSFGEPVYLSDKKGPINASVEKLVGDKLAFGYMRAKGNKTENTEMF